MMGEKILVCWIGLTDLNCSRGKEDGLGPVAGALTKREFARATLITDAKDEDHDHYVAWLAKQCNAAFSVRRVTLSSPMDFGEVHNRAVEAVVNTLTESSKWSGGECPDLSFHLSPGTSAMAAVWVILAKTRFPARLIASKRDGSVYDASVPFDISADYIGELLQAPDAALREQSAARPPENPAFSQIVGRSTSMQRLKRQAQKAAPRSAPVLILGESGTGKELFARAIHGASGRKGKFIPVNCGAIPRNIIESELFGNTAGAFTGARVRKGHFREAEGGTLFLDELGELPLDAQVTLLRALQEGEITPVGASAPEKVNVRIIAATNKDLPTQVVEGTFREDLFYRLAVAILRLPALREREGDMRLLVDAILELIIEASGEQPGFKKKNITAGARSALAAHSWPGNVRELYNTLMRAAIWSDNEEITKADIRDALIELPLPRGQGILERPLGGTFNLAGLLDEVSRHYINRALEEAGHVKKKAAVLVGFKSHQRLTDWMDKLGMEQE